VSIKVEVQEAAGDVPPDVGTGLDKTCLLGNIGEGTITVVVV
jgi:hypothetical protein